MHQFLLQLKRLRRHYEVAVRSYDHVSLLDLSHSLRIWADLKNALPPSFNSTIAFKSALPAKKVMRAARDHRYIFAYMPGGVLTFAAKGQLAAGPDLEGPSGSVSFGVASKVNTDGSMELKNFCYVGKALEQPLIKALAAEDTSRGNFVQWLGAEVVRLGYPQEDGSLLRVTLSREILLRRVANTLDGSHPAPVAGAPSSENRFDKPVVYLMQYQVGGLPLPYFILLKTAQDILAIAPKLLAAKR